MTNKALRKTFSLVGALAIAAGMVGATLDVASARTLAHRTVARGNVMHDASVGAPAQDLRQMNAAARDSESRIQVPSFNGGLQWVPEEDYHGGNADD